jgi:hypothetical protein
MSSNTLHQRRPALTNTQHDIDLPPYTPRHRPPTRDPVEHVYQLGNSKPWATLRLISRASSPKQLPIFYQNEPISGSLELNLEKGDAILSVTVAVKGRIITGPGAADFSTFLDHRETLWSRPPNKSRTPSPTLDTTPDGKLQGDYLWPISINLPSMVTLPNGSGGAQVYDLPHTFLERQTRASVQYDLTVRIYRTKLRSDSRINTPFAYIPHTKPEPLSLLRQAAYRENSLLPGPDADPEGWKTTQTVVTRGTLFTTRYLMVKCKLSLAKPLCYTRGTAIPCLLDIECDNRQGLNVLSSTTSAIVKLQRRVKFYLAATSASNIRDVGWKEIIEDVNSAVWWPTVHGGRMTDGNVRRLDGEIRLPKDMKPSSSISHFSVSYAVVVCPFEAEQFKSADTEPLLVVPVEIATKYARGPKPKPFSPPGYDASGRRPQDYHGVLDAGPFHPRE